MSYEIVEFIVNNRESINSYITLELATSMKALGIFDNHPDLQDQFLDHKKLMILRDYIANHFSELNPEDILSIDDEILEFLKEI